MAEIISTFFIQGNALWAAIAGPLLYFVIVGSLLGIVIFLVVGERRGNK